MTQQTAYYSCDTCNSTWHTGWDKDKPISEMRDYCHMCVVTSNYTQTPICEPIHVTNLPTEKYRA